MFDLKKEWSISFAGCGFMGIYYVGATSCILERFPGFIRDASKIYGASAGALMASVLSVGIPLEKCCADLMFMAKEARKHKLGPLHPAYNLLQIVKDSLQRGLPEDAHVRASGKLCVSLTRVSDGKNVLVSEFDSREELVQALVCSCFVPFYCGVIPPTYRGVHYVDGAVSDNLPRCHLKNTITFSAYAGESDVCPRGSTLNFHEVRFNNVSIQVNTENMYRVASTFFPPEPEAMAEICQNGYVDALRFLQENNLISSECPLRSLETDIPKPVCCELAKEPAEAEESNEDTQQKGLKAPRDEHWWLDPQLIDRLPVNLKKALCEACRETRTAGGLLSQVTELLPDKVTSYLRIPCTLPVESACSLAQRLVDWIPDVPRDMSWFYGVAGDIYKKAWKVKVEDCESEVALHRSTSLPLGLNLWNNKKEDVNALPLTPETTPTSSLTFTWNTNTESDHMFLTPPPTPTFCPEFGKATVESPKSAGRSWGLGLGRAVGWIRHSASEQGSNIEKSEDSMSFSEFK
ncbi:patatin-like phospholipase domain-containing protein 2 [Thunnus albacares]|uniref:patatin-like phospholipase domain-containing protein 2 n=1 Tax=Thunnus albacares TaxID=8236 RepID=UPI001CF6FF61|nr:patatin-like phospholipase domain-containing protein 2 [Thunnus albacares]XP_044213144.1 patatin-like phospholipase domain-containing protein 2 [Thunnus albacares]